MKKEKIGFCVWLVSVVANVLVLRTGNLGFWAEKCAVGTMLVGDKADFVNVKVLREALLSLFLWSASCVFLVEVAVAPKLQKFQKSCADFCFCTVKVLHRDF